MSPEAQRIAIALHIGWTPRDSGFELHCPWGCPPGGNPRTDWKAVPNFTSDLNAMHWAESVLNDEESRRFIRQLESDGAIRDVPWLTIHSTAAQRAEAFLRAIGKWEDGK